MHNFDTSLETALQFDKEDKLAVYREKFHFPKQENGKDYIYFCGNSLGLMPKQTEDYIAQELKDWKNLGVEAHFLGKNPWKDYHEFVSDQLAELVGADPSEVVAMGSLTTNLNLLLISFFRPNSKRYKIIAEGFAFPSDLYSLQSHVKYHNLPEDALVLMEPRDGETCLRLEDIKSKIDECGDSLALVLFGNVNYYNGHALDMPAIVEAGHNVGAIVGFDLAHGIGNLTFELSKWEVDFAVWCSYKYLNSGPGATAGIYINNKHGKNLDIPRLSGWWGANKTNRFKMQREFDPMLGAQGWQNSNPAILPLACLKSSLDIFSQAGIYNLREKAKHISSYLEFLVKSIPSKDIEIITPTNPDDRGAQLSIRVKNSNKSLFDKISQAGVIADWREPDVIRVATVPLYNSYNDCYDFYTILNNILSKNNG